ncbi:recombinase family protein [Alsobacter sp. KACC 23698]|uniref:recombinase family protein n=1 Tax=Alsobacter sp. KACC 23698 TaxID=3149229 RepID=UPI003877E80F
MERIFREFGAGKSPEAITKDLNREGVPGPGGRPWSNTTLRGQARRGTGVLHNALYRGVLEWKPAPDAQLDILLHPRLPELYRRKVETLEAVLDGPDRAEAMDVIRSMIKKG